VSENDAAGEVMTLSEVAEYLQLAEKTVLRMTRRGEIPAAKVASQWRFLRPMVREWLVGQMHALAAGASAGDATGGRILPTCEVFRPELMTFDLAPGPKEDVLRQLVAPLGEARFARDPEALLRSLLDRERMMTTAVGHGIAVPHPRRAIAGMFREPAVALGICPAGTDFGAIDDQLVHVFFLVCATRDDIHLRLMAEISWLTRREGVLAALRRAASPSDVLAAVGQDPGGLAGRGREGG